MKAARLTRNAFNCPACRVRIISCILVTNEMRDGAKAKISGEEMREFIVFYVRVTVHRNKFLCNRTN